MKYLIEELWMEPLENRLFNASGYKPFGYAETEEEAKSFCATGRIFTGDDCWSLDYGRKEQVENGWPQFRYSPLEHVDSLKGNYILDPRSLNSD